MVFFAVVFYTIPKYNLQLYEICGQCPSHWIFLPYENKMDLGMETLDVYISLGALGKYSKHLRIIGEGPSHYNCLP